MVADQTVHSSGTSNGVEDPVVTFESVTKRFGRVTAIDEVSLSVNRHEILGIIGDNGAGKSTLMNILAGLYQPTTGRVTVHGTEVRFADPSEARDHGIETVYQDLALMDDLDIATNIFMGRFPARFSIGPITAIDWPRTYRESGAILDRLGQDLDLHAEVEFLSGGQRQLVAVARALLADPEIIIFDEPTSALSVAGTELVHETIGRLQEEQHTQIIVSHSIEDVIDLVDRIAVMFQGQVSAVVDPDTVDREVLTEMIKTGGHPEA